MSYQYAVMSEDGTRIEEIRSFENEISSSEIRRLNSGDLKMRPLEDNFTDYSSIFYENENITNILPEKIVRYNQLTERNLEDAKNLAAERISDRSLVDSINSVTTMDELKTVMFEQKLL